MYCLVIFDYELPQTRPLDQQLHHGDDCLGPPLGASGRMVSAATAAGESRGGLVRRRTWIENTYQRRRQQHIL
jgi:hypothetical protein